MKKTHKTLPLIGHLIARTAFGHRDDECPKRSVCKRIASPAARNDRPLRSRAFSAAVCIGTLALIAAALFSCNDHLLPEPAMSTAANSPQRTQIQAPVNVKATHGKSRTVTLAWDAAASAVQYRVYSAAEPYYTFNQVGETKGTETTIDISEKAGTTAYYKIKAVDYEDNESEFSGTACGSAMAQPIIAVYESASDGSGTSASITWWMQNCTESTYQNDIIYDVVLSNEDGTFTKSKTITDGSKTFKFEGLEPKTHYYYEVSAYLKTDVKQTETSGRIDRETAMRLIPEPPQNLAVSQGDSEKEITVSWTLPPLCDVKIGADTFEAHPLYFTVERKAADESIWTKRVTYAGTCNKDPDAEKGEYRFECTEENTGGTDSPFSAEKAPDTAQTETSDTYPGYIPGWKITYTDSDTALERGKIYTYRVQSYTDDTQTTASFDSSAAEANGHLIAAAAVAPAPTYKDKGNSDEATEFEKITVSFADINFDARGQKYTYLLYEEYTPIEETGNTAPEANELVKSNNYSAVTSFLRTFDFSDTAADKTVKEGYYRYILYILPENETNLDTCITSAQAAAAVTVVKDKSKMFKFTKFDIEDGYSNKFVISWNYEKTAVYTLLWKDSENGELQDLPLLTENLAISDDGKTARYEHEATSGDARYYSIQADTGVKTTATYPLDKTEQEKVETLGTPKPTMSGIEYDQIIVTWDAVQAAKTDASSFTVTAQYKEDEEAKTPMPPIVIPQGAVEKDEETGGYKCTIKEPAGFDDPAVSGKPIELTVTARSAKHAEEKTSGTNTEPVCTLGPALVNAAFETDTYSDQAIKLQWNAVNGAEGYLVYRLQYENSTEDDNENAKAITYFVPASGETQNVEILYDTQSAPNGHKTRETIEKANSKYTFRDIYQEAEDTTSAYQNSQARLAWGLPHRYIVLPVKDKGDFAFDETYRLKLDGESKVNYTPSDDGGELESVIAATSGYGLNVVAEKAKNNMTQTVTWDKPYSKNDYYPSLWKRDKNGDFVWVKNGEKGGTQIKYDPDDRHEAYEYIVKYNAGSKISPPDSLIAQFANTPDSESPTEQQNKGYLLAINETYFNLLNFTAEKADGYGERVSWSSVDIWGNDRALCPTGVKLYIRNNNLDAEWHEAAIISGMESCGTKIPAGSDVVTENGKDLTGRIDGNGVILEPESIAKGTSGTTNGYLKVLRDYKHYYGISFTRGDIETVFTPGFVFGDDTEEKHDFTGTPAIYAYREITAEEMVRAATLAMAYGAKKSFDYRSGSIQGAAALKKEKYTETSPGTGSAFYNSSGGGLGLIGSNVYHTLEYENFRPVLETKSGEKVTFLCINGKVKGETWSKTASCPSEEYNQDSYSPIEISCPDVQGLYSTKLTFNRLNKDKEARYTDSDGYKGIKISYPSGNSEKTFGNITPLPFGEHDNTVKIDFQVDSEEWQ
ncbi:MAG: fibronectin type III domain-containing protein [Bacteroides sp.]|nr:fibronectin type III domain-containing protein [Prevotella sp.]MCM1407929.1 fibronectin type III domain-containing protein [Treponema brennaborense]MCM1469671.1 fibronectin type III domain-containing protein [Bacteroides sp.]